MQTESISLAARLDAAQTVLVRRGEELFRASISRCSSGGRAHCGQSIETIDGIRVVHVDARQIDFGCPFGEHIVSAVFFS